MASRLLAGLKELQSTTPRLIHSPPSTPRASVALILRIRPAASSSSTPSTSSPTSPPASLDDFFNLDWVRKGTPELLFIQRASRPSDRWSSHVAFPGGRQEADDEDSRYTALRETWEEVGLDLAEAEWMCVGRMDDREITTSFGKRLLMVLSPFLFLHTSPSFPSPELQPTEVASLHLVPLSLLSPPLAQNGSVPIDIATRLAPRSAVARKCLRLLIGDMHFESLLLPNDPVASVEPLPEKGSAEELRLWGLTLGMTLDLLASLSPSPPSSSTSATPIPIPSSSAIVPQFTYPDISLLVYLFSLRSRRRYLRDTQASTVARLAGGVVGVNHHQALVKGYYAAVRKALVIALVVRGLAVLGGVAAAVAWWRRAQARRGGVAAATKGLLQGWWGAKA